MPDEKHPAAESSTPAPLNVPTSPEAYATWRQTGELPDASPSKSEAATPSTSGAQARVDASAAEADPASEAGQRQERTKNRTNAESRLREVLDDLKTAGLSPAELKTFRREAQQAADKPAASGEKPAATPPAAKPVELNAPKKPEIGDYADYEAYEAALETYQEAMAEYRVERLFRQRDQAQREAEAAKTAKERLAAASERYGDGAAKTISDAAQTIFSDAAIPAAIRQVIDDSPIVADVLYAMGSKGEVADFVALCKSDPSKAIRQAILMEHLVAEELAKTPGASASAGEKAAAGTPGRDPASGKFTPPPASKITKAPPPPIETSGRSSTPIDPVESAATAGDFGRFRNEANRRDLARMRGQQ
jgi:hypothetical protein